MSCQESGREIRRDKHNISCIWANNKRLAHLSDKRRRAAVSEAIALVCGMSRGDSLTLCIKMFPLHLSVVVSCCNMALVLKGAVAW